MEKNSGCGCCGCGCLGCLLPVIVIIMVIAMVFSIFTPMNHHFEYMIPDDFQNYFPDFDGSSSLPSDEGATAVRYELRELSAISLSSRAAEF